MSSRGCCRAGLLIAAYVQLLGCVGMIGDTEAGATLEGEGITSADTAAFCDNVEPVFGKTALRRMNTREVTNALRDLLGDATLEVRGYPTDYFSAMGFDTDDVSTRTPPLDTEKILEVFDDVIAQRLSRPQAPLVACESAGDRRACLTAALPALLRRAFRAPPTAAEVNALADLALSAADAREGTTLALTAVIASPRFLFHVVDYASGRDGALHALSPYELAQRLSFFLWSSIPDVELLDAARDGELDDDAGIVAQARRMLADERAAAFLASFPSQWLGYRKLATLQRSPTSFPEFDAELRAAMREEANLLFRHVVTESLPIDTLVTADFSFANARLAEHYGMREPVGAGFVRVPLDGVRRRGILTQAAVMTATSQTNEPSPIHRGLAVLEHVLCTPVPAPPDGVATLERIDPALPMRDRLAQHRSDPSCAACHNTIDPVGLAFGNFDAVGKWRDLDQGKPIDATGTTDDGTAFSMPGELATWIGKGDKLEQCVAEHLAAYAVGRVIRGRERCQMSTWLKNLAAGEQLTLTELVERMVVSPWFRTSTVQD